VTENDSNSDDDQSNYETPATPSEEAGTPSGPELAGRGRRFGAYMIDWIIAWLFAHRGDLRRRDSRCIGWTFPRDVMVPRPV